MKPKTGNKKTKKAQLNYIYCYSKLLIYLIFCALLVLINKTNKFLSGRKNLIISRKKPSHMCRTCKHNLESF